MRYQGYLEAMNHHVYSRGVLMLFRCVLNRLRPTLPVDATAVGYAFATHSGDLFNDLMAFGAESALGERGLFAGKIFR